MTQSTTSISELEERAFVIVSNNEVKEAGPNDTELLDNIAGLFGIVRMDTEGDDALRSRLIKILER